MGHPAINIINVMIHTDYIILKYSKRALQKRRYSAKETCNFKDIYYIKINHVILHTGFIIKNVYVKRNISRKNPTINVIDTIKTIHIINTYQPHNRHKKKTSKTIHIILIWGGYD